MSASHATVKLSRSLVEEARREAGTFSRSIAGQIEHWIRLGRTVEAANVLTHGQTRRVLATDNPWAMLSSAETDAEREAAHEAMIAFFQDPPPDVREAYREIGSRPGAVGDDENGVFVRIGEDGKPHPI